ncbi:MAG: addiction module protein [Planctomycetes bacterium]|nr:addiction module protein [Planctomycetota bacterium]
MTSDADSILQQALKLTPEQKLALIGLIMDSLEPASVPQLSAEQLAELERRLDLHRQDPSRAIPFEDSMKRVHAELERRRLLRESQSRAS